MKILILAPLFPPDTGAPASYVKELSARLALAHRVTLFLYGYLPETVSGVTIHAIDKRKSLFVRLFAFTRSLFSETDTPDLILVNNAPSIELPFLLYYFFKKPTFVLLISDPLATKQSTRGVYARIHRALLKRAFRTITVEEVTYQKDEILPFVTFDTAKEEKRVAWWETHIMTLCSL
jgi:glycosyltransferase involved in cell wall biosynthesis